MAKEFKTTNFTTEDHTHRTLVLAQIERCNRVISDFNPAQEQLDNKLDTRKYISGGAEGKKIALSIRILLSISRRALPKKFFDNIKIENKYKKAFEEDHGTFPFLSEEPNIQFRAIMKIITFYDELVAAIFSLEEFSDIKAVKQSMDKSSLLPEDEELLFETLS